MSSSPIDDLLETFKSAVHAKRAELIGRLGDIQDALEAYRRAAEGELARSFARDHQLRFAVPKETSLEEAAERLRQAVLALPELRSAAEQGTPERNATARTARTTPAPKSSAGATVSSRPAQTNSASTARDRQVSPGPAESTALSQLVALAGAQKLVILGALSGRRKDDGLPDALTAALEWIDTERDGVHAIGNLPQRIRQGRVMAVVILDRAVQHKHTEPVVNAARDAHVPVAFAGKGGRASLARALEALDTRLRDA